MLIRNAVERLQSKGPHQSTPKKLIHANVLLYIHARIMPFSWTCDNLSNLIQKRLTCKLHWLTATLPSRKPRMILNRAEKIEKRKSIQHQRVYEGSAQHENHQHLV